MSNTKIAPFGSWKSPIISDDIVSNAIGLGDIVVDGKDLYWLEKRPSDKGRNVIVKLTPNGEVVDVNPSPFNVRTRVHEYGGGAFTVANGVIYFSNFVDGAVYKQTSLESIQCLTQPSSRKYANFCFDAVRNSLICVCEDSKDGTKEPENSLVSIDINSGDVSVLVSGNDFYSSPTLSKDGSYLAYFCWNHPNMPWDTTELWIASLNSDGSIAEKICVSESIQESICQPQWGDDGSLYFSSDRTGWWNLYRRDFKGNIEPLFPLNAEFGYPHWVFGESIYGFSSPESLICTYTKNGCWYLASLNTKKKLLKPIKTPYTRIAYLQVRENEVFFIGGSPNKPSAVVKLDLKTEQFTELKTSNTLDIDEKYISIPEAIAFETTNGKTAYAWYYPPTNGDFQPPEGELPPLLVKSHGGPTAATSATLSLKIQYWTSRGFAFCDVNYGGSTGYGREYRQRLYQNWGVVDVEDCINAAQFLVKQGKVDGERLAITGGSAGGYTTLAALTFHDTFKAGASYYGVSDLEALVQDTHKFESRYLDSLVGLYPDEKEVYQARSPINFTEKLSCPVIFLQGLEDKVVPPNQAEKMVEVLKGKGLPVAYITFPNEQHGFRMAENIKKAIESEFYFYSRIFGYSVVDDIEPVEIINM